MSEWQGVSISTTLTGIHRGMNHSSADRIYSEKDWAANGENQEELLQDEDESQKEKSRSARRDSAYYVQSTKEYWMEFCRNTSLHGLQYVGEEHRPRAERIFWIFAFFMSLVVSWGYIAKVWEKWHSSPVIVTFSERSTRIWEIPFPAVTICSEIKVKQTLFNYSAVFMGHPHLTEDQLLQLDYSSLVCESDFNGSSFTNNHAVTYIEQVTPSLEELLHVCTWRSETRDCAELFSSVLTDDGVCYTFNILPAKNLFTSKAKQSWGKHMSFGNRSAEWNLEEGYLKKETVTPPYPYRSLSSGANAGLTLILKIDHRHVDPLCLLPVNGFKMVLHNPAEFPQVSQQYFRVPLDRNVVVGVKPWVLGTSPGLKEYDPQVRQCFFSKERYLQYFQFYTQENCEVECLINFTLARCNCVAFYMPTEENTTICGSGSKQCLKESMEHLYNDKVGVALCNCLPACTEIKYDVEISQAPLDWKNAVKLKNITDLEHMSVGIVSIYFREKQFISSHRGELYGTTDFLANCGGLLGLFLGFSILSLVEILYFFTVRIFCNLRRARRELSQMTQTEPWRDLPKRRSRLPVPKKHNPIWAEISL